MNSDERWTVGWNRGRRLSAKVTLTLTLAVLASGAGLVLRVSAFSSPAFDRGCAEMSRRDYDSAIVSFGEAIGFDMNNKEAYLKRGECFFHLKNYRDAMTDFDHLLQMQPRYSQAHLWRGTVESKMGNSEAAVRDYVAAIKEDPGLAKAYDAAPPSSEPQKTENPGAVADYKHAMDVYHQSINAGGSAAGASAAKSADGGGSNGGNDRDANAAAAAANNADQQTDLDGNWVPGHKKHKYSTLGSSKKSTKDSASPVTGTDSSSDSSTKASSNSSADNKELAVGVKKNGKSSFDQLNPPAENGSSDQTTQQQRISELTDAIRANPDDPTLYFKRGRAYHFAGNDDKALKDLTDAVRINPEDWHSYLLRASIYDSHNEPDLRDVDVRHARNANPKLPRKIVFYDQ